MCKGVGLTRWLTPARADPTDQSWNWYSYVSNNPPNATDPSGMELIGPDPWDPGSGGWGDPCGDDWGDGDRRDVGPYPLVSVSELAQEVEGPRMDMVAEASTLALRDWNCSGGICVPGFGVDGFAPQRAMHSFSPANIRVV